MAMPPLDKVIWLTALNTCLITGVHDFSYKASSFLLSIPRDRPRTPIADALDLLITSPLTRLDEKVTLVNCKKYYLLFTSGRRGTTSSATKSLRSLLKMFQDDEAERQPGAAPRAPRPALPYLRRGRLEFEAADFGREGFDWFAWVEKGVLKGAVEGKFKGGAFEGMAKKTMSVAKMLNVLLGSSLTSAHEKQILRTARDHCKTLLEAFPSPRTPGEKDVVAVASSFDDLWAVFKDDAKTRETYQPPVFIQTLDDVDDTKVLETYVLNEDGSATVFEGGTPFVPPGAPEEWIKENAARSESMQKETGRNNDLMFASYRGD